LRFNGKNAEAQPAPSRFEFLRLQSSSGLNRADDGEIEQQQIEAIIEQMMALAFSEKAFEMRSF